MSGKDTCNFHITSLKEIALSPLFWQTGMETGCSGIDLEYLDSDFYVMSVSLSILFTLPRSQRGGKAFLNLKPWSYCCFSLFPGNVPCPVLQQVAVRQLGEVGLAALSFLFLVLGILELTKEKTEERTDNSWR